MTKLEESAVPAVLIGCPYADWFVPTGQTADRLESLQAHNTLRRCPECGRDHDWTPADAMIAAPAAAGVFNPVTRPAPMSVDPSVAA